MCKKSLLMMLLLALLVPWAANAQTSLFSEDFEGGSMPAGWTTDGSGSWSVGVGDYSTSTGAGHGSYNAMITHGSTGNVTKLITPEIDLSTVASAELSFMHIQRSWAGDIDQLRVYYRTSSSGSWTQIAEYTAAFASWTTEDGIVLPDLSSTYQIAFEHTDKYGYGVGVDNIVIVQGASCPKPTGLTATANGQSATLTWIGDASSFHVAYSTDGTANPDNLTYTTVNTNSYTKDNLALDADHYFWVRAYCSATEQSNWAGPASVHIGYCVPAPTSVDGNGISNVTFGTGDYVVNNDTPKATYADYHTLIGAVQAGVESTIAITFATGYTYNTYVWVDLDNSLSFDADEVVCYGESTSANPTTLTLSFTIPADQTLGDFRLRIGSADSGLGTDPAAANPCYSSSYGCFQDYTLRVLEAPSCLPPTGLAVSNVGGHSATLSWTSDGNAWQIGYSTDGFATEQYVEVTENPYTLTGLDPETAYQVRVQTNCGSGVYSIFTNPVSFTTDVACPAPSGLAAALTPGNGSVAILSWTSEASAWVVAYKTADATDFTELNVTENPYKLTGLTPETTYNAKVKAVCGGEDGESEWSNTITFTPTNAYTLTVNDGTDTHSYVPFYGYYADSDANSQFIIPADGLSAMTWGTIEKLTFYTSTGTAAWNGAVFDIYFSEVDYSAFETAALIDWSELSVKVYTGTVSVENNKMELTLTTPYNYMGGNLLIGFDETSNSSNYPSAPWYGVTQTNNSAVYKYSSNNAVLAKFLPKVTFGYTPGEEPACMWPTNLAVNNITPRTAELSWTSDGTAWQIGYSTDGFVTEQYVEVTENPYTLTGLNPETDYEVRVQKKCDENTYSIFTNPVSFTTGIACFAPTDLVISDITAYSANIGWTSENTNIEMRYAVDNAPVYGFEEGMEGWTTIDTDGDGFNWALASETFSSYTAHTGEDMVLSGSYDSNTGTALTPDNYLVSPQITLGGSITFWACAQDASWAAEHFGVAVSTTGNTDATDFTTIAEWTFGSRSANVLRSSNAPRGGNREQAEWVQYTVDLSAYSGQGYVAIRHFNCTDMFYLNVDDITIIQPGDIEWMYVTNPTNPQALTGLDDETKYIVQVRANCGDEGYSSWLEGTFTTLPLCMVPTDLVISNVDKRSADLAWTPNGDETQWQICLNGDETNLILVSDTSYSFTNLTPETLYNVKVRAYCDETLQSHWSSPATFITLVACPAPTGLAISDITNVSAVATWTYDGDVELEYAEDVWMHYDNGVSEGSLGYGTEGQRFAWASMFPADMLTSNNLTHVALYEIASNNNNDITLIIYKGGETAPETQLYTETFAPMGTDGWHEVALATPVTIDPSQNLWVVFSGDDAYPAQSCADAGTINSRWTSLDNGESWADLASYGVSGRSWMIRAAFDNNTQTEWVAVNNPASPQTIAGLTPETNYMVRLRAVCGGEDGESVWVNTSFTTDIACPAPYALAATPYALSAELSWEGVSESYTVSYRTAAYTQGISEEFATSSAPTGWTRSNTLLTDDVLNGTTALATYNGGWNFGTSNGVFDSHARVNIYSTSCKYWLVTPAMEVPAGAAFSFDLALTAYSGTVAAPATTGTDDKFVVLVSTDNMATWTILRQWDNAGSEYVYNNIANTATGENVSFDFSAYAGQTVYVAFYGESTTSNADNNLHIDNVAIGTAMPAGEWMTVNVDEATATITGLTPETKYEWKVQGNCGEWGMSEESAIATFTTSEDTCPTPTNLTASNITYNSADLSWNGSPDVESFTVRYRAPQHAAEGALYETFGTSIPTGWTLYTGLLDTVMVRPSALTSATYGWSFGTGNGVFDTHARVNIYGNYQRWLVTPEVTVAAGANLAFDMALTVYTSSSNASPTPGNQADDKFIVLISTDSLQTWNILRQWDNQGSEYVYDEITNNANGQPVSIDLSAYVGQTVHIAFYGESTVSGGDNNLHIDNVIIGEVIPATEWQTVTTTDMNVTLTGLTYETTYEAQVKSDCSDPEAWSTALNFTTAPLPTQTIALNEGWNWVSFDVEITLNDLKAVLLEAVPGTAITIRSKTQTHSYNPSNGRWSGRLTWDLSQMYRISVTTDCEVAVQGFPVDPAEHPANVLGNGQFNWIAFPLSESMSLTNAFAGFAVNGDLIRSKNGNSQYNRGRWQGSTLTTLQPGQGYIYKSSTSAATRTLTFPGGNRQTVAPETVQPQPKLSVNPTMVKMPRTIDLFPTKK